LILPFLNNILDIVFGPTDSFFITTTPKKFLFEGVEFCRVPVRDTPETGIAGLVCDGVRDEESQSIIETPDGEALVFSMFNHVSLFTVSECPEFDREISNRKTEPMMVFMR
jgi:hypothetical protein